MAENPQRPAECSAEQAFQCHTERDFRRSNVYCQCLGEWVKQNGDYVMPWTYEAPTEAILLERLRKDFPSRDVAQANPRQEQDVARPRWVAHF